MNFSGFQPDQLVARGVFDSREGLDRVMCELDDVRPGPVVTRLGWGLGMISMVGASRLKEAESKNAGSNLDARAQVGVTPDPSRISEASSSEASARKVQFPEPTTKFNRARVRSGVVGASQNTVRDGAPAMTARTGAKPAALCLTNSRAAVRSIAETSGVTDSRNGGPTNTGGLLAAGRPECLPSLCIYCAWERAMQPGPRMAPPRINGDVVLQPCERHASRPDTHNNPQPARGQGHETPFLPPAA